LPNRLPGTPEGGEKSLFSLATRRIGDAAATRTSSRQPPRHEPKDGGSAPRSLDRPRQLGGRLRGPEGKTYDFTSTRSEPTRSTGRFRSTWAGQPCWPISSRATGSGFGQRYSCQSASGWFAAGQSRARPRDSFRHQISPPVTTPADSSTTKTRKIRRGSLQPPWMGSEEASPVGAPSWVRSFSDRDARGRNGLFSHPA
jgi:hypothetical protein